MSNRKAKEAIIQYSQEQPVLNFIMKTAPFMIFLKPVLGIFASIFLGTWSMGGLGFVLYNLDALATLAFIAAVFYCFVTDVGFPLIGALALQIINQLINVFTNTGRGFFGIGRFSINPVIYLLAYIGLLVLAVIISARKGEFQKASQGFKEFMAPRQQQQPTICTVCGQGNIPGANFCTSCGSQLPQTPQPPAPQAPQSPQTQDYQQSPYVAPQAPQTPVAQPPLEQPPLEQPEEVAPSEPVQPAQPAPTPPPAYQDTPATPAQEAQDAQETPPEEAPEE